MKIAVLVARVWDHSRANTRVSQPAASLPASQRDLRKVVLGAEVWDYLNSTNFKNKTKPANLSKASNPTRATSEARAVNITISILEEPRNIRPSSQ